AVRPLPLPLLPVDLLIHEAPHLRSAPAATPPASPFPGRERVPTLLEAGELPLAELAELARCEGQSSRPIYRVHRWFARRLSTQFRALLAALTLGPGEEE